MKTVHVKVYTYDELSVESKQRAISQQMHLMGRDHYENDLNDLQADLRIHEYLSNGDWLMTSVERDDFPRDFMSSSVSSFRSICERIDDGFNEFTKTGNTYFSSKKRVEEFDIWIEAKK